MRKGFTLMEVMVVTGLLSLLAGITYSLVQHSTLTVKKGYYRADVHENLRIAADRMSRDIRQALDYTIGPDGKSIQITRSEKDSAGKEIIKYITYSHDPVDLEVERRAKGKGSLSPPGPFASHISSLRFEQVGNQISIWLTGQKTYYKEGDKGHELYDREPYQLVVHTLVVPRLDRE